MSITNRGQNFGLNVTVALSSVVSLSNGLLASTKEERCWNVVWGQFLSAMCILLSNSGFVHVCNITDGQIYARYRQ